MMKQTWKDRLYSAYVSSNQVTDLHLEVDEQFASRRPYIQMVIRERFPVDKSIRILDLGCGSGAFLYFLQNAGYQNIQGVDVSTEQVALAARFGISVEHDEIAGYLAKLKDEIVDVVLLMDVLEHFCRQELLDLLDGVYRVVRPGGKCIAHVPNASGLYGMQVRYGDLTHELAFTPKSVQQAFATVGFCNIQCYEDQPVVHGFVSGFRSFIWKVGTIPSRLLLSAETGGRSFILSQNMLVTAIKPALILESNHNS
jgi:2-polyprenyl-3-methyl-5-hydroxy-6-metoxy-1,4-benzoquinol methylase